MRKRKKQLHVVDRLNYQLSEVSSIAQHKEKALKELAFAQSHLVRSPLSKILGLISLLESCEADDETKFIISLLSQSTSELDNIVTDIVKKNPYRQGHILNTEARLCPINKNNQQVDADR